MTAKFFTVILIALFTSAGASAQPMTTGVCSNGSPAYFGECDPNAPGQVAATLSSPPLTGRVEFDYSRQNGIVAIGEGDRRFNLSFSSCSDACVHFYRGSNVRRIAAVAGVSTGRTIGIESFDTSSHVYSIRVGERALVENNLGYFAQVKVIDVEARSHGGERDRVVFDYQINTEANGTFTAM